MRVRMTFNPRQPSQEVTYCDFDAIGFGDPAEREEARGKLEFFQPWRSGGGAAPICELRRVA